MKELTGLTGADMDLFLTNDFYNQSELLAAEICEYLPAGEGWKYVRDGRIAEPAEYHAGEKVRWEETLS